MLPCSAAAYLRKIQPDLVTLGSGILCTAPSTIYPSPNILLSSECSFWCSTVWGESRKACGLHCFQDTWVVLSSCFKLFMYIASGYGGGGQWQTRIHQAWCIVVISLWRFQVCGFIPVQGIFHNILACFRVVWPHGSCMLHLEVFANCWADIFILNTGTSNCFVIKWSDSCFW